MRLPKVCASVSLLFLVSCASSVQKNSEESIVQSEAVNSSTQTPSPSVQPTSSAKMDGSVTFDKIDSTLIAPGSKFDIQFSTESTTNCSHTIKYPQVSGLANTTVQTKLNQSLRQNMIEQMRITGDLLDGNRCPQDLPQDPEGELRLYTRAGGCRTHFAELTLVSTACGTSTLPGAYPHPQIYPVTFDLATGKIYQFADLFKPDSNYPVRVAVAMRDAWQVTPGYIYFPFHSLETTADFDFYFQEDCDQVFDFYWRTEKDHLLGACHLLSRKIRIEEFSIPG